MERGASMSLLFFILIIMDAIVHGAPSANGFGDIEDAAQRVDNAASSFKRSPIRTTVVNLNDSNTDNLFRNFNVSKDEIYRRITQHGNAETQAATGDAATEAAASSEKRNNDERWVKNIVSF